MKGWQVEVPLSGGYQSPTERSLRQDAGDAQRKAPMAPRIPASSLPVADLNAAVHGRERSGSRMSASCRHAGREDEEQHAYDGLRSGRKMGKAS